MNVSTPANAAARPSVTPGRIRIKEYETIYVLRSDVDAETAERIQSRVGDAIEREQGKTVKVEAWGRRRLAYPIGKQRRGVYVYVKYVGGGGMVAEVERNLKLQDAVMKFMTVQTNDEVDLAALKIDPEEAKLGKFELPPETEPEESREKQLGLVDLGPDAPRGMSRRDEGDEYADEGGDRDEEGARSDREAGAPGAGGGAGEGGGAEGGSGEEK
ncbi:MAG TPA: 30S ribosomal protein S6 [Polyangiaceae bacterium]